MNKRTFLLIAVLAALALVGVWVWRTATAEPMAAFREFPYTYITESAGGYDASKVVVTRGSITGPAASLDADGTTAWPAYIHPDDKVVPRQDGKPYIIPLIAHGTSLSTPRIAPLGRPLNAREIADLERYQTPEGSERMAKFRQEMGQ